MEEKIALWTLRGYCCSQIMVLLALELLEEENDRLVNAAAGLCGGLSCGKLCGVLSGGALALSLFDADKAHQQMIPALVDWFEQSFGTAKGNVDCRDLVGSDVLLRIERCPEMMRKTQEKIEALLEAQGLLG